MVGMTQSSGVVEPRVLLVGVVDTTVVRSDVDGATVVGATVVASAVDGRTVLGLTV